MKSTEIYFVIKQTFPLTTHHGEEIEISYVKLNGPTGRVSMVMSPWEATRFKTFEAAIRCRGKLNIPFTKVMEVTAYK